MKYGDLITVGLKACNQREYIAAAIEGAFAQTYRPLEIVVSDDGSTDGTWELIGTLLGNRKDEAGGLRIIRNRNEKNLGNMGNWLKICELSHGEWIVKCDGDDMSEPGRVEEFVRAVADKADVKVATCGGVKIGPDGKPLGRFGARSAEYPFGACMAFHRDCFERFPQPGDGRIVDDEVFARRALMLGAEVRIDMPLVRYRVGTGISSGVSKLREPELRCMRKMSDSFRQSRIDAQTLKPGLRDRWLAKIDAQEREVERFIALRSAADFATRWHAYRAMAKPRGVTLYKVKLWAYLLPRRAGDVVLALLARIRYSFRV